MLKQRLSNWKGDIVGGIMTSVVALPVAMAFGVASGLGTAAGLYGAMICGLLAAVFGGTRGQQTGPTGPIAVVVAALLAANQDRIEIVFAATILAGLLQIVFGRLGWGGLVRYVPYPVVSGFMTGVAMIIILLHLNPFFGIKGTKEVMTAMRQVLEIPWHSNTTALAVGICTLVLLYGIKKLSSRLPAALLALTIVSTFSVILQLDLPRIGAIPNQLPLPSLPNIGLADISIVVMGALTIAVLGSVDSLLTSLIADKMLREHHDSNRELVGQGIGNMCVGLLGGLAGAGSTTRTIANIDAGGRTALAGIVYGALIFGVISFLGDIAATVPLASLAAILISLGIGIIDWRAFRHVRAAPRSDTLVMFAVLILTVCVDLISAVLIGTALACILFVKKITDARLSECGPLIDFFEFEHLFKEIPETILKSTFLYTFNGPMFFGETKNLLAAIQSMDGFRVLVLNLEFSPFIDQSCCYFLEDTIASLRASGIRVIVLGTKKEVLELLERLDCHNVLDQSQSAKRWSRVVDLLNKEHQELIGTAKV